MTRPDLVSETIGDETIVLDMRSGTFYATRGAGSAVWAALQSGHTPAGILEAVDQAWGQGAETESVRSFLADLGTRGLLADAVTATPATAFTPGAPTLAALEVYDDLSDLMLLDPVHDVTTQGWPSPARD